MSEGLTTRKPVWAHIPIAVELPENGAWLHPIRAQLVLGALSENCTGDGICKVLPMHETVSCCQALPVSVSIDRFRSKMLILVHWRAACRQNLDRLTSQQALYLAEPFTLPSWLCSLFACAPVCIHSGTYPLQIHNEQWEIRLPLLELHEG